MKKLTKGILTGLCAVVVFSAGATLCALPTQIDVETTCAESTYTTKDVAMLGSVAGWYGNGNFEIRLTLGECDWAGESGQKSYTGNAIADDLPGLLTGLDFFNHIQVGGKTLAEWGCTTCYANSYWLNEGEPKYTLVIPLAMGSENMATATAAGVGANSCLTILEGALIPSYAYLQGDASATVYRAGCNFVTESSDVAYGLLSYGKTEVESIQYVTSWDSTYNNAYLGVSLKGDDYVGAGTQTERRDGYHSSVYTTNRFNNKILVDGESGKAEEYGLFNLGEKGKGYYSFVFRAAEADSESITIPAGTLFPSYAMKTLYDAYNNPVYIMYETQTDVTFVKNAEGVFVKESEYVADCIETAKAELDAYKAGLFREAEETQRAAIVAEAKAKLNDTMDEDAVKAVVADAKVAIDALKTAAQYADEELAEEKSAALAEIKAYKADEIYFDEQVAERTQAMNIASEEIASDTSKEEITETITAMKAKIDLILTKAQVIENAKAELDGYKADEGYFKENEAAQRAEIVATAKDTIDNATTATAVKEAVTQAKESIDNLTAASEYYTTHDVAMMARLGGWYGNGNFTLKITLGYADWTNENAGVKEYDGDLTKLLTKLDFFNNIKLGEKTLAEWGCTACYDNGYELNTGEPDYIFMFHLAMGKENMDAATAAGISADMPVTVLKGALVPSYGYLTKTSDKVYSAGCDYVAISSMKAYGIEATAKTTVESVKYVQGHDGTCGYFGISFVGDDYLGNGSQLDVNQNYYFENKFIDYILVNGEAGKVGYYGLFNLGANGVGYYAFQIFVPEEDLVSITILPGAKFPTRAMTDLYVVNGNPVYIMYEVENEITLYKTANGYGTYAESAAEELANYKAGLFREEEETQRLLIISQATESMQGMDNAEVDAVVASAKLAIDELKTAAQYADEELANDKQAAISEMEAYKADVAYLDEQAETYASVILEGKEKVALATTVEELAAIVEEAKDAIDELTTKESIVSAAIAEVEGYKADLEYLEAQATEKAAIVEEAKTTIESATSQAVIEEAVANAKTAIDQIKTKAEIESDALTAKQEEANTAVDALKKAIDFDLYEEDAIATINSLYATVKAAIENATTEDEINAAVAEFKSALAEVPQKGNDGASNESGSSESSNTTSEEEGSTGCFGVASGLACSMMLLAVAGTVLFKKKEN